MVVTYHRLVIWEILLVTCFSNDNIAYDIIVHVYQNLRSRFGIERYAYTENHIGHIPCLCMYVIKLLPNHWTDLHKNYTSK